MDRMVAFGKANGHVGDHRDGHLRPTGGDRAERMGPHDVHLGHVERPVVKVTGLTLGIVLHRIITSLSCSTRIVASRIFELLLAVLKSLPGNVVAGNRDAALVRRAGTSFGLEEGDVERAAGDAFAAQRANRPGALEDQVLDISPRRASDGEFHIKAAAPATWGVAIDVPEKLSY